LLREIDPLTSQAYKFAEELEAELPRQGHSHDAPWHVSFHGSEFPGDDPKACGRRAIYTMLDIPRGMFPRWSRQIMDAGKDIEIQITHRWHQAGMLLSSPPESQFQTQFEDPDVWLTTTVDAIVLRPRSLRPAVAEIKSKYAHEVEAMRLLLRGPDEDHVRQVKTEIGLAHEFGEWNVTRCINSGRLAVRVKLAESISGNGHESATIGYRDAWMCPEHGGDKCLEVQTVKPVEHGFLYYVSRDDPANTREFYYEYDPVFMEAGREQLRVWRKFFEEGVLPATQVTGKNPMGWNWTTDDSPCKFCPYGSNRGNYICRLDHEESVKRGELLRIEESEAIEHAREIRPEYDLGLVRAAVFARWNGSEQS